MVLLIIFLSTVVGIISLKLLLYLTAMKMYDGYECMIGKVVLIVGGSRGVGLEISKCLALRGCKIIVACRSNAEIVKKKIADDTQYSKNIIVKNLDLKSFQNVRNFAQDLLVTESKIDILINNAGVGVDFNPGEDDGFHPVLQTNILSPFLLTHLLLPLLKKSDDARIIFTSSTAAFFSYLTRENLNPRFLNRDESAGSLSLNYANSKLAQLIASKILANKLEKFNIKSNVVHPGLINTEIYNNLDDKQNISIIQWFLKELIYFILYLAARNPFEGAQGIVTLAASKRFRTTSGEFFWGFFMHTFYPNPPCLKNEEYCKEIWKEMEILVKLKDEEKI